MILFGQKQGFVFDASGAFGLKNRDRYWAERGLIHVEDSDGKNYKSMTVPEAIQRVAGLSACLKAARQGGNMTEAQQDAMQTAVERFIDLIKLAKSQGDPTNPAVVAQRAADFHKKVLMGPS